VRADQMTEEERDAHHAEKRARAEQRRLETQELKAKLEEVGRWRRPPGTMQRRPHCHACDLFPCFELFSVFPLQSLKSGQRIIVDLEFEDKMHPSELKSLCQQLSYVYSTNKRSPTPCHLILTGVQVRERASAAPGPAGLLPQTAAPRPPSLSGSHLARGAPPVP
jgi:tRNA (guanine9-N1)-methyltransferase